MVFTQCLINILGNLSSFSIRRKKEIYVTIYYLFKQSLKAFSFGKCVCFVSWCKSGKHHPKKKIWIVNESQHLGLSSYHFVAPNVRPSPVMSTIINCFLLDLQNVFVCMNIFASDQCPKIFTISYFVFFIYTRYLSNLNYWIRNIDKCIKDIFKYYEYMKVTFSLLRVSPNSFGLFSPKQVYFCFLIKSLCSRFRDCCTNSFFAYPSINAFLMTQIVAAS